MRGLTLIKCQVFIMVILFSWDFGSLNHASGRRKHSQLHTGTSVKDIIETVLGSCKRGVFSHVLKLSTQHCLGIVPKYRNVECAIPSKRVWCIISSFLMTVDFSEEHDCDTLIFAHCGLLKTTSGFWPCFSEAPGQPAHDPKQRVEPHWLQMLFVMKSLSPL